MTTAQMQRVAEQGREARRKHALTDLQKTKEQFERNRRQRLSQEVAQPPESAGEIAPQIGLRQED